MPRCVLAAAAAAAALTVRRGWWLGRLRAPGIANVHAGGLLAYNGEVNGARRRLPAADAGATGLVIGTGLHGGVGAVPNVLRASGAGNSGQLLCLLRCCSFAAATA